MQGISGAPRWKELWPQDRQGLDAYFKARNMIGNLALLTRKVNVRAKNKMLQPEILDEYHNGLVKFRSTNQLQRQDWVLQCVVERNQEIICTICDHLRLNVPVNVPYIQNGQVMV